MSTVLFDRLGPRGKKASRLASIGVGIVLAALLVVIAFRLESKGQLEGQRWAILLDPASGVPQTLGLALLATLQAALLGMVFSLIAGAALAAMRLSSRPALSVTAAVLVEGFRGVPLLLLMLFAALGLPQIGIELSVLTIVVLALVVYNSAVISEIIRAGIESIGAGQREAALAMGMRPLQVLFRILMPQAIPAMTPLLVSQMVILLKDTSIGYVIGYAELLRSGRSLVEFYGNRYSLQIYLAVALIYILVNVLISLTARRLTRRNIKKPKQPGQVIIPRSEDGELPVSSVPARIP
ncbi:amino acid ABC transporter permease [Arthrobacter sp. 92]|jgi:glutamate transport system permease protein|uniref:amino acid ABC transporter permease n=1 Tax=Arthrobacter sp. 92 TaxID=3418175 RepID=UPI0006A8FA7D|nr:glutamate transport system permease protein GluD [Arthrobacter sp. Hiyo6]